jgi:hypothetical protein
VVPSHGVARARVCGAGSVAEMGGAAVSLPCREVRIGEAWVRGDACEGGATMMQAKGVVVSLPCRRVEAEAPRDAAGGGRES